MHFRKVLSCVWAAVLLVTSHEVMAQEFHGALGFGAGYLILGGSAIKGRPFNPSGGLALLPRGEVTLRIGEGLYVMYAQTPMPVNPVSLTSLGFLDTNDLGLAYRSESGAWSVSAAGTFAVGYMRFCNSLWCLRQGIMMPGAEVRASRQGYRGESDNRLLFDLAARFLYAEPTAWTWPGLPDRVIPIGFMGTFGAKWQW